MFLLIPFILYSGLSASFFVGLFPSTMHLNLIAPAQICYGIAEVVGSVAAGRFANMIGRVPVLCFSFFAHAAALVFVYLTVDHYVDAFFICATTLFGLGDSCLQTIVYSILPKFHPEQSESAFAFYKLLQSLGYTICFLLSVLLQTHIAVIVYVLAGVLVVSSVSMSVLQFAIADVNFDKVAANGLLK